MYLGPLAEELATEEELAAIHRVFDRATSPVLDLACGYGRHLGPLSKEKFPCIGMDFSGDLLERLPARARKSALRGDMRELPFSDASLAGAYLLFNSFGYFSDEGNLQVLSEIARAIRPGGKLLMDAPARSGMQETVNDVPAAIRSTDGIEIYESWTCDRTEKRLVGEGTWKIDGETAPWELSIRLYTPTEMTRLLRKAGFSGEIEIRPLDDIDNVASGAETPPITGGPWRRAANMIIVANR